MPIVEAITDNVELGLFWTILIEEMHCRTGIVRFCTRPIRTVAKEKNGPWEAWIHAV